MKKRKVQKEKCLASKKIKCATQREIWFLRNATNSHKNSRPHFRSSGVRRWMEEDGALPPKTTPDAFIAEVYTDDYIKTRRKIRQLSCSSS